MSASPNWSAAADPARRVGHTIEFHAVIGSTNDWARDRLSAGLSGVAIVADQQTAGRGRRGRTWVSPPGANLMFSVGYRPRVPAAHAWWLAASTALAVKEACATWSPLGLRWPNDIVAADRRKVAGLLVETALDGDVVADAVIGVGINVNWPRADMPPEIAARATSLAELAGGRLDRVALLDAVLTALDRELAALDAGISPLDRYRDASALSGRDVLVAAGDLELAGRAAGIADDGSLLIDTPEGRVAVAHGEVLRVVEAEEVAA
jgi:BirA family biotin operon repressor/biotin-[acetyl-CoA-carboxylase] ligase